MVDTRPPPCQDGGMSQNLLSQRGQLLAHVSYAATLNPNARLRQASSEEVSRIRSEPGIFHLVVVAVLLLLCAWERPGSGQVRSPEPGVADKQVLAQKWDRDRRADDPTTRSRRQRGEDMQLLSETMRLVKEYYFDDVSPRILLGKTFGLLAMTLPPQCTEDVEAVSDCPGLPEQCFMQAVDGISEKCGLDKDAVLRRALNFLLRELDPNSSFLDAAMLKELEISMSGKFGGVGMVVSAKDGEYVVVSRFDSSPAEKAGIQAGNVIEEIDGRPLDGLSLIEVLSMVRGTAGSNMSVTIRDPGTGQIRKVTLRRQVIRIPPVRFAMLDDGVAYLRIVNFQEQTVREVAKALTPTSGRRPGKLKGLILDLRDNPGGLFTEAIRVADLFLSATVITSVRGRNQRLNREFTAIPKETALDLPTVILINKGTASAAEILAGALQGRPNILVAGERSFGKASVQAIFPLRKGAAVRLTTAHYFTADGRDIDGKGLDPDIQMESPQALTTESLVTAGPTAIEVDREIKDALHYLISGRFPGRCPFSSLY
jgi:carboxyl-terminal processing protease